MREREAKRVGGGRGRRESGFTIIQMLITLVVLVIVVGFGVMGIASARTSMRVQSSARAFASYVEKARADAIRRHATSTVAMSVANATSYVVTMDFDLDGVAESRTITLEEGVYANSAAATLTFDWRGRLSGEGLSFSFVGPGGSYPVQLDVTGSGDVTIGEEKFADSEVPEVVLNNGAAGGDVLAGVTTTSPTTPTTPPTTPPATPPGTPPSTPPSSPPSDPPGNGGGKDKDKDKDNPPAPPPAPPTQPPAPPTQPPTPPPAPPTPPTQPPTPPTQPPTPPVTPPTQPTCTITADAASIQINSCNGAGKNCGSGTVKITLTNASTGATVSASGVPSHLSMSGPTVSAGVYTFTFTSKDNTRTTNDVTFTGTSCGSKVVSIKTK